MLDHDWKKMLMITVGVGLGYKVIYSTFPPPPTVDIKAVHGFFLS